MKIAMIACSLLLMINCTNNNKSGQIVITFDKQEGEPIAKVGSLTLTVEEMKTDFLERQGQFKGAPNLNTEKARKDYIESQVMQKAMFLEAQENGYFNKPEVRRDIEKIVVQKLMRDKLENSQNDYQPSDEQIKDHYEKNQNLYNRQEALKVAYINIPFGNNKTKTNEVAKALYNEAVKTVKNANTRAFSKLAMSYAPKLNQVGNISIETNETDYLEKTAFDSKFGKDAFDKTKKLESIGEISPLLTSDQGFVIMMKTGYRKDIKETVEEAKGKIVKRLSYENRGEVYKKYLEDLKKKYDIKIYEERLAELSKNIPQNNVASKAPSKEDIAVKTDEP